MAASSHFSSDFYDSLPTSVPGVHLLPHRYTNPEVLVSSRIVCDEKYVYYYANNGDGTDSELWKYNIKKMQWTLLKLRNMVHRYDCEIVLYYGRLLLIGGSDFKEGQKSRQTCPESCSHAPQETCDMYSYRLDQFSFERIQTYGGKIPPSSKMFQIFTKDIYLYTLGGTNECNWKDVRRLNLNNYIWEDVNVINLYKFHITHYKAVHFKNKVYIVGGKLLTDAYTAEWLNTKVLTFDLISKNWILLGTIKDEMEGFPQPRSGHTAVHVPKTEHFLMFGGMGKDNSVLECTWMLNTKTYFWTRVRSLDLKIPVRNHSTTVTPTTSIIFTFGGDPQNPIGLPNNLFQIASVESIKLVQGTEKAFLKSLEELIELIKMRN